MPPWMAVAVICCVEEQSGSGCLAGRSQRLCIRVRPFRSTEPGCRHTQGLTLLKTQC